MRNGADVKFSSYVKKQGWGGSSLYATWHNFLGLKNNNQTVYIMTMKTTTGNMITSSEAYKKFKALGMRDVIKLDGGGSLHVEINGKSVISTAENRLINNIICFDEKESNNIIVPNETNPYQVPTVTLKKGNPYKNFNKWLQWQLTSLGFKCTIDGSFGAATRKEVLAFQKSRGLAQDGSVGALLL